MSRRKLVPCPGSHSGIAMLVRAHYQALWPLTSLQSYKAQA